MARLELLAAGDRRLVGIDRPGIFIDAARVDRVRVGHLPGQWGISEPTWFVEVFTKMVEDREADPPMIYSAEAYQFDYPDKASAEREAERVRAFVAHGLPGAQAIAAERQRQIDTEGWTPEHDDEHTKGELLLAAIAYTVEGVPPDTEWWRVNDMESDDDGPGVMPDWWPWSPAAWKPTEDARGNLVKAGALIAAELDRLARAGAQEAHDGAPDGGLFAGSNSDRQSVGLPGHCERCAAVGHVAAHPELGCGDVGCHASHGEGASDG